ncbi:MAG: acylphosphatase [Opitutaceae bacterium]
MTSPSVIRSVVHFAGHVQGVGFRYTVMQTAREFEVAGFVENLPDGRVLLEAEGDVKVIDAFVGEISDRMSGYIRKTERADQNGPRVHQGFTIR